MSATTISPTRTASFPIVDGYLIATILFAGAAATLAFDVFGQAISPLLKSVASPWLGAKLAPVPLAQAVLAKITGVPGKELGAFGIPYALHALTGLVIYPLGYLLAVRPVSVRIAPQVPWFLSAVGYGVMLWVFALYAMAHLIAGNPPFLGFGSITWVALWAHIVFALTAAAVIEARLPR